MLKAHSLVLPTYSQVAFRLAPGGAEQLVAYDEETACYTPLLLPRQLATGHAGVVLPPALAPRMQRTPIRIGKAGCSYRSAEAGRPTRKPSLHA